MRRRQIVLIAVVGVALAGVTASEYRYRRVLERRYDDALTMQQRLQQRLGEVLTTHQDLQGDLAQERQRSRQLTETLAAVRGELTQTEGRLTDESRTVRELQLRLAAMQQQMEQLQGELAITLQGRQEDRQAASDAPKPIALDRVVVSDARSLGLNGRVLSVHEHWDFVVIDFGWDEVKIGDIATIVRNDELMAKVRIERVQEGLCAATVLPEWDTSAIHVNDLVRLL